MNNDSHLYQRNNSNVNYGCPSWLLGLAISSKTLENIREEDLISEDLVFVMKHYKILLKLDKLKSYG